MRYFEEVEVSPLCLPHEAAEWIVRGKLPTSVLDDDWVEVRGNIWAAIDGFTVEPEPLSEAELRAYSSDLGFPDYIELFHRINDPASFGGPWPEDQVPALLAEKWERQSEAAAQMRDALSDYFDRQEQARAEVIAAIVAGRIEAQGFWAETMEDLQERFVEAERVLDPSVIPNVEVVPSRLDWTASTLQTRAAPGGEGKAGAYFLVTFKTAEVLAAFPPRRGQSAELLLFNGAAILRPDGNSDIESFSGARPRGRPARVDYLKAAVRDWYSTQKAAGTLGGKKEADLAAAIQFAASLGHDVKRTSVQKYLEGIL